MTRPELKDNILLFLHDKHFENENPLEFVTPELIKEKLKLKNSKFNIDKILSSLKRQNLIDSKNHNFFIIKSGIDFIDNEKSFVNIGNIKKKFYYDFINSKFKFYTLLITFSLFIISSVINIYDFGKNLVNQETKVQYEQRLEKLESKLEKLSTSILNLKNIDSLNNPKVLKKFENTKD